MTELYEKSLRKLELDNVLAQLADCANSEDGKDRCRALLPLDDAEEIRLLQQQTTAACGMIVRKGAPGFHELKPVAASLERADRGGCLTPVELLRIAGVLRCIRNVKAYYSEDGEPTALSPLRKIARSACPSRRSGRPRRRSMYQMPVPRNSAIIGQPHTASPTRARSESCIISPPILNNP